MRICLFSCYDTSNTIRNYVKFYLEELKKHNDRVICITNNRDIIQSDLDFLNDIGVEYIKVDNTGFDFGMWYKLLQTINKDDISQLTLANDSCILFRNIKSVYDFVIKSEYDYCGITDNIEKFHHIQSYFLVIKKQCINDIYDYFNQHKIVPFIGDVVDIYEIGLSQYMTSKGFRIGSMFDCTKIQQGYKTNIAVYYAKDLIDMNCPIIKKKVIFDTFSNDEKKWILSIGYKEFDFISYIKNVIYYEDDNINTTYLLKWEK